MPIVQISVWNGMSLENKKKTFEGITKVFEELGVPRSSRNSYLRSTKEQLGNRGTTTFRKTCPHPLTIDNKFVS